MVGDSQWVEEVATTFANHMLVTCPTPFERTQLLKLLAENGFGQNFVCQSKDECIREMDGWMSRYIV